MTADPRLSTAQRASGSSFYAAMRMLPRTQRDAMFEIYSFCRMVDDIADSEGPRGERLTQLRSWRADIEAIYAERPPPHLAGLARTVREFALDKTDFMAVIDGMEMDVVDDIRAPSLETLDLYCDRVASAVGRLSVRVFGLEREAGLALSHHLGRALQLTNILRDIDKDAELGRLYLPREWLREAGIEDDDPASVARHPGLARVCARLAAQAQEHFAKADAIMARAARRAVRAPRIMAEVYRAKLDGMIARGWSPPRRPVSTGRWRLAWILLRHAIV
jgi:phytoene synthase